MEDEPVVTIGAIQAAVAAFLTMLVVFGVDLSKEQIGAILALFASTAPIAFAFIARRHVTPYNPPTE